MGTSARPMSSQDANFAPALRPSPSEILTPSLQIASRRRQRLVRSPS